MRRLKSFHLKENSFINRRFYYVLAFCIPVFIMLAADIALGVFPFGERAVLIIDSYHQYAPFFSDFYDKVVNGGSLMYTWHGGLGINFWAVAAYYLASPLNILMLLFPRGLLIEAFTLIIMIKVGLSGLSFAYYISKHYKKYDITIVYFSLFYALSGWVIGYNWNIMWLDCIVMLPLIILGLEKLVREGRGWLYGIALGICIFCNYYISIMICIFLVIYFFVLFFQRKKHSIGLFINRGLKFAGYSLLAGGLGALMLLPAYFALMHTHSADASFPKSFKFYENFWDILSQHMAVVEPTDLSGLPNLYCGVIVLMFFVLYLFRKKTPLKQKLFKTGLLILFVLSCNVNILDYIWHGFHYPNSLPNRFTFIYIFLLLTMCYEVFLVLRQYSIWQYFTAFIAGMGFIICTYMFREKEKPIYVYIVTMLFIWVYFILMTYYKSHREKGRLLRRLFLCVLVAEVTANGIFGLLMNGSVNRISYNSKLEDAGKIRNIIESRQNGEFCRTEIDSFSGRNNVMWLGFNGVSMFSSTLSDGLDTLMDKLGFFAAVNKFSYGQSTTLADSILGVKYLASEDKKTNIRSFQYTQQEGILHLYTNPYALPAAFMVDSSYPQWSIDSEYPWEVLNDYVVKTTGITEALYSPEPLANEPEAVGGTVTRQGDYSFYFNKGEGERHEVIIKLNPSDFKQRYIYYEASHMDKLKVETGDNVRSFSDTRGHIVDLGQIGGEEITIRMTLDSSYTSAQIKFGVFSENSAVFEAFYAAASESGLKINSYTDTHISGQIDVQEDGILFTSIPYDKGWKVKVDGKNAEVKSFKDSLLYIELSAGAHTVEMDYMPQGFIPGAIISSFSLLLFTIFYYRNRAKQLKSAQSAARSPRIWK